MKKALVVFLAVAMLFAFSAAALAAPADLDGQPTNVQDAFNKFLAFKFIEGYEDGTVRPNGEITRAEFAKVICMVTGLSDVANALQNTSSQYKDVLAGKWYVGYVAAATASGFFQGYGDGTFRPDNLVTEYEVLAVLLRVAGYKDEGLSGAWPYNYVTQASRLGWLSLVSVTGANATRATAVLLANTALFEDFVAYSKDSGMHSPLTPKQTVAAYYKALGETKPVVIKNFALNRNGVFGLYIYDGAVVDANGNYDPAGFLAAEIATGTFYPLFDNCDIVGGLTAYDMINVYAEVTLTKDGKIAYIEPITRTITTNTFTVNTARTTVTIDSVVYSHAFAGPIDDTTAKYYVSGDANYKFIVDIENNLFIDGWKVDPANTGTNYGVVASVKDGAITAKAGTRVGTFATAANLKDKNVLIIVDGKEATADDIKTNAFVIQFNSKWGYDYIYEVYSAKDTVVSTIDGISGAIDTYTIDGKKYKAATYLPTSTAGTNFLVRIGQGTATYVEANVAYFNTGDGLKGKAVSATFSADGKLAYLNYGARADATTVVGLVTGAKVYIEQVYQGGNYVNKPMGYETVTVFTANGESKTYALKDNGKNWSGQFYDDNGTPDNYTDDVWTPLANATFVTLSFDDNDEFVEAITPTEMDKVVYPDPAAPSVKVANNIFTVTTTSGGATSAYQITAATKFFSIDGTKYSLKDLTDVVVGGAITGTAAGSVKYITNGLEVRYVVITGGTTGTTTNLLGIIESLGASGDRLKFRGNTAEYKYVAANVTGTVNDIIKYTVSGSGNNITATQDGAYVFRKDTTAVYKIKAVSDNLFSYITVEDDPATTGTDEEETTTVQYNANTKFYVYPATGNPAMGTAEDLKSSGASVRVIGESNGIATDVVIVK